MQSKPRISILLSVYNGEAFLSNAIKSITNQTFSDFEFICIDDGSTDSSYNILANEAKLDKRIVIYRTENLGLAAALNNGIDIARGFWIARMDADDIACTTRLEKQINLLTSSGADICGTSLKFMDARGPYNWNFPRTHQEICLRMLFRSAIAHPTAVIRTDLAKRLRYNATLRQGQDYDLWTRAAIAGAKFVNHPEPLLKYRRHNKQASIANKEAQNSAFSKAQNQYALSLGLNQNEILALRQFGTASSGRATKENELELMAIMHSLSGFDPKFVASEYENALQYRAAMSISSLINILKFRLQLGLAPTISPRSITQALIPHSVVKKIRQSL